MNVAYFVEEIVVTDPVSKGLVEMEVYKHENGGMFAVDSSYLDQCFEEDNVVIPDPLEPAGSMVKLIEKK